MLTQTVVVQGKFLVHSDRPVPSAAQAFSLPFGQLCFFQRDCRFIPLGHFYPIIILL